MKRGHAGQTPELFRIVRLKPSTDLWCCTILKQSSILCWYGSADVSRPYGIKFGYQMPSEAVVKILRKMKAGYSAMPTSFKASSIFAGL